MHCRREVEIGARTRLMANLYIEGPTWIGEDNIFYPYSTVGVASQDLKYKGERAETRIGSRNRIREFVTIHRGTQGGGLVTRIGDDNLLMPTRTCARRRNRQSCDPGQLCDAGRACHGSGLGGHQRVHRRTSVLPHRRHAIIGGYSVVVQDVMPFSNTVSERPIACLGQTRSDWSAADFPKTRSKHYRPPCGC